MPRIRTLKPECWSHRKVGRLSHRARLLWVGCITQADDEGRLIADPEELRVKVFPYDPPKSTLPELHEIAATGLIRLYQVDGTLYADIPDWLEHQKINRAYASTLPAYTDEARVEGTPPSTKPATRAARRPAEEYAPDFVAFWSAYPRPVGKGAAWRAWQHADLPAIEVVLKAIETQRQSKQWRDEFPKYVPHPATWLNRRGWEDGRLRRPE